MRARARQQPLHVEARGGELGLVERRLAPRARALLERHLGHPRPQVAHRGVAEQVEVVHRAGAGLVGVLHSLLRQPAGGALQALVGLGDGLDVRLHRGVARLGGEEGLHGVEEAAQVAPGVRRQLAPDEVHRLDAVGALVDLGDARVAHELLHAVLGGIAIAAADLQREVAHLEAEVGLEGLHDRSEQGGEVVAGRAPLGIGGVLGLVDLHRGPQGESARPFGEGADGEQHAPHVGVDEDRVGRELGRLGAGEGAPLQALAREGHRSLVGGVGEREPLHADVQPGRVHHREHGPHPFVRLADEIRDRGVEVDGARGGAADPHLVLDRAAGDPVGHQRAALLAQLGDEEHADPLDAGRGVGEPCQHQVEDVLGEVVLTGRDEDLAAGDAVGAVAVGHRARAHEAQVGAGLRLRQAHRPRPAPVHELRDERLLELVGCVHVEPGVGAVREEDVHREGEVGGTDHLARRDADRRRHALAAVLGAAREAHPAALPEQPPSLGEAVGSAHSPRLVAAALRVARRVERPQHLGGDLPHLLEHCHHRVGRGVLETGEPGQLLAVEELVEDEAQVAKRRGVGQGHRGFS